MVEEFKNNKNEFKILYEKVYEKKPSDIVNNIEIFIRDHLIEKIGYQAYLFIKFRSDALGINMDSMQFKEIYLVIKNDFGKIVHNYVVDELLKYHKTLKPVNSYLQYFTNQKDFVSHQKFYLEKICDFLEVDYSKIILESSIKQSNIQKLTGKFNAAHAMKRTNGMYEIAFNRLSGYVVNGEECSLERLVKYLLHEVTHIKQYETRRLIYDNGNTYWENQLYNQEKLESLDNYKVYLNLPWEIEARENEAKYMHILTQFPDPMTKTFISILKGIFKIN